MQAILRDGQQVRPGARVRLGGWGLIVQIPTIPGKSDIVMFCVWGEAARVQAVQLVRVHCTLRVRSQAAIRAAAWLAQAGIRGELGRRLCL